MPCAPPRSPRARVRQAPHGHRTLSKSRCCHQPWLHLRLVLPEVCDVPKVFLDPLVGIDGVEVAFSAVMKNERARCASGYPLLHLLYRHQYSTRRAPSENGLAANQAATTHNTVQVRHPHTLVSKVGAKKLGASGRAVPRNEPLSWLSAENHAPLSINCEDLGAQVVIPNVFGATSERATRAGGYE